MLFLVVVGYYCNQLPIRTRGGKIFPFGKVILFWRIQPGWFCRNRPLSGLSRRDFPIIARRFNAGLVLPSASSPAGTAEAGSFSAVPAGLGAASHPIPALKRRAIVTGPSGTCTADFPVCCLASRSAGPTRVPTANLARPACACASERRSPTGLHRAYVQSRSETGAPTALLMVVPGRLLGLFVRCFTSSHPRLPHQ